MKDLLVELEQYIGCKDVFNETVSAVTVSWHIEHTCKVLEWIIRGLVSADPLEYKPEANTIKEYILTKNRIGRGKGISPAAFLSKGDKSDEQLALLIDHGRFELKKVNKLDANAFFVHPLLGVMRKNEALQFLRIHTEHHLKIIRDIIA